MEHIICEPFELTEFELDAVVGSGPLDVSNFGASSSAFSHANFAIGAVLGDSSTASGIFAGVVNIFDIDVHPTTSIVIDTSVNIGIRV